VNIQSMMISSRRGSLAEAKYSTHRNAPCALGEAKQTADRFQEHAFEQAFPCERKLWVIRLFDHL
jgi:hypothetical protein